MKIVVKCEHRESSVETALENEHGMMLDLRETVRLLVLACPQCSNEAHGFVDDPRLGK